MIVSRKVGPNNLGKFIYLLKCYRSARVLRYTLDGWIEYEIAPSESAALDSDYHRYITPIVETRTTNKMLIFLRKLRGRIYAAIFR